MSKVQQITACFSIFEVNLEITKRGAFLLLFVGTKSRRKITMKG